MTTNEHTTNHRTHEQFVGLGASAAIVGTRLDVNGHALTTFGEQDVLDFRARADDLIAAVNSNERLAGAEVRTGMVMLQNPEISKLASAVVQPFVDKVFADQPDASTGWNLYGVNHYAANEDFKPHQDYFDGTVMIITVCGERRFDVYEKEPEDDSFKTVDTTYELGAGSVVLLNGHRDLGHAARCVVGPSISIVADVALVVTPEGERPPDGRSESVANSLFSPYEHPAETAVCAAPPGFERNALPAAMQARADEVVGAFVTELGLDAENVRLVVDGSKVVAIDASPNGQHVGSFEQVVARRKEQPAWYFIDVAGEKVDVLAGNTDAAYRSMVRDAAIRGVPLPDSLSLSQQNGVPWTATMLTGEPLTEEGRIQVLSVNDGNVNRVDFELHRGGRTLRVRPAVVVSQG